MVKYLIALDMDGTITENISWRDIHEYYGTLERALENKEKFLRGEITFAEWVNLDVALWREPPFDEVREILLNYRVRRGFKEFCESFKDALFVIISGGLDIRAYDIAANYGIHKVFANPLLVSNGRVVGGIPLVTLKNKGEILSALKRRYSPEITICIGDTDHDNEMFKEGDISVAFADVEGAEFVATDFRDVLEYLKSRIEM